MQGLIKTEAVILRKRQLLNKDFLITLFTEEKGKIGVMAKGARDIKSRRLSALMTGNLVTVILSAHHDRLYLQEARIISLFSSIKKDEIKHKTLYLFLYLFDSLLPEGQREPEAYILQKNILVEPAKKGLEQDRVMFYLRGLLKIVGYATETDTFSQMISSIEEIIGKKIPAYII